MYNQQYNQLNNQQQGQYQQPQQQYTQPQQQYLQPQQQYQQPQQYGGYQNQLPQQQYGGFQQNQPQQQYNQQYAQQNQNNQQYNQLGNFQHQKINPAEVIETLVQSINYYNINLQQLFQCYDIDGSQTLKFPEFLQLVQRIKPGVDSASAYEVFVQFDQNYSGEIGLMEFQSTINRIQKGPQDLRKAEEAIIKLKYSIDYYKIDLNQLFGTYDSSKDRQLDRNEFGQLLQRIDNSLNQQDINNAFILFDADGSGTISMQEFQSIMYQINSGSYQFAYYQGGANNKQMQMQNKYNNIQTQQGSMGYQQNYQMGMNQNYNQQQYYGQQGGYQSQPMYRQ